MLKLKLEGLEPLRKRLASVVVAIDRKEILDEAAALLLNRTRSRFLAEVDPEGVAWAPSQRVLREGGKTLFLTGKLFHSLQAVALNDSERAIATRVPYAQRLQSGNPTPRRFLGVSREDLTLIERRILQRIEESIK